MKFPDDYLIPGIEPFHVEEAGIIYCGKVEEILPLLSNESINGTALACKEMGRRFVGIEENPDYAALSVKRLRQGVLNFGSGS